MQWCGGAGIFLYCTIPHHFGTAPEGRTLVPPLNRLLNQFNLLKKTYNMESFAINVLPCKPFDAQNSFLRQNEDNYEFGHPELGLH